MKDGIGESVTRYVEDELDLVNQILQEKDKKAFKYDCLVKKISEKLIEQYNLFNSKNQKEYSQEVVDVLEELIKED